MPEIMGSYLYELKPYIDKKKWKDVTGDIDAAIKSKGITWDDWERQKTSYANQIKAISNMKKELEQLDKMAKTATGSRLQQINTLRGYEIKDGKRVAYGEGGLWQKIGQQSQQAASKKIEMEALGGSVSGKFGAGMAKVSGIFTKVAGAGMALIGAFKKVFETSMELANKAAKMSNQLNVGGSFMDMGTRDVMSRYGVNAVQANAMQSALTQMGLNESDLGRLTSAQREAYDELINHFQEGIDRIDPRKLEEFYDTMDEFQMAQAKWKMDIQNAILKLFAESDSFKKLTGSIQQFFELTVEFLESPVVQWFFDVFIEFLNGIMEFANFFLGAFGGGESSGSSTTNNNTSNTNTYYIYGSDYANNDDLARSIALKQGTGGAG